MHSVLSHFGDCPAFGGSDAPMLVVDAFLTIQAANPAYLTVTDRTRDELIGVALFDAFPDNPDDPGADGVANLSRSLETVFRHSRRNRMALQRYDVRSRRDPGRFDVRFWDPVNSPVLDERARVVGAIHHVEDVTPVLEPILSVDPGSVARPDGPQDWSVLARALAHEVLAHDETREEVTHLRSALESRVVIEQAKGILMASWQCSSGEAFEMLRSRARNSGSRVQDLALDVVQGTTTRGRRSGPAWPASHASGGEPGPAGPDDA
jgi:hypothetical protein